MMRAEFMETHRSAAEALCGGPISSCEPVAGGGNNRVFRVETPQGTVALKSYPRQTEDPRDRLGAEFAALRFLAAKGETSVPKAIACDRDANLAAYEWIDGEGIGHPGSSDIETAVSFARRLRDFSADRDAKDLAPASEACFSGAEIIRQIEARVARLRQVADDEPELQHFLDDELLPALERAVAEAEAGYSKADLSISEDIAADKKTLSPSDFGFHNALRRGDGSLVFIDFEYFGWDDPVRVVADFMLHPGMDLETAAQQKFFDAASQVYSSDRDFEPRFRSLFQLVALRWCVILLNEFLPEKLARRTLAGAVDDPKDAQKRQLTKARRMIRGAQDLNLEAPHGH